MPDIADYLDDLVTQRNALADNLVTQGVTATHAEKLNSLVPKVLEISGGGSDTDVLLKIKTSPPTAPQTHKNTPDVGVSYTYEITD